MPRMNDRAERHQAQDDRRHALELPQVVIRARGNGDPVRGMEVELADLAGHQRGHRQREDARFG